MTKKEIKKRIEELTGKLDLANAKFSETNKLSDHSTVVRLEGEIAGLEWVLKYWDGYYEKV